MDSSLHNVSKNLLAEAEHLVSKPVDRNRTKTMSDGQRLSLVYKLVAEYAKRKSDALELYEPLPGVQRFHESGAQTRLLVGSNRAGKTLGTAAEVARIVRGLDPYHEKKGVTKLNGRILCVAKDEENIGDPMWKKLSFPGAFQILRDPDTNMWRSVRAHPDNPLVLDDYDEATRPFSLGGTCMKPIWKPSPPLIPPSAIESISYLKKGRNIPRRVLLKSGWELLFFSSKGSPRQGVDVDIVWFDEEIENNAWYGESMARLLDRSGIFIWDCTPQSSTAQLHELHMKAMRGDENLKEFNIFIDDNPYHTALAKKTFYDSLLPEERAVRYYGEYAISGRRVYPSFDSRGIHGVSERELPQDWMRVVAIDPGFQRCAALFAAINPSATEVHFYDEIYIKNADATQFADAMRTKCAGHSLEAMIIDNRMGRQSAVSDGKTIEQHYANALKAIDFKNCRRGIRFEWGMDNIPARTEALLNWIRPDGSGKPVLKVHTEMVPNFVTEMQNQYYKKDQPDKRETRHANHLVDTAEYIAAWFVDGLWYREPETVVADTEDTRRHKAFLKLVASMTKQPKSQGISLGPTH